MQTHQENRGRLWRRYQGMIKACLFISLSGLVYVYPFHTDFRFTISIAVLSSLLLYFPSLPVLPTVLGSGLLTVVLRCMLDFTGGIGWQLLFQHHWPTLGYYLFFGISFSLLQLRRYTDKVSTLLLGLILIDVLSNCIELSLRQEWTAIDFAEILRSLVGVSLIRAITALAGYYALGQYHAAVLAQDHLARYAKLLLLIAQLRAEMFFLKKSSADMEKVMEKSYLLYKQLQESATKQPLYAPLSLQALAVAREIHEIKKDYGRLIGGMENVLDQQQFNAGIKLSEIFWLLEQNTLRYLQSVSKQIEVVFQVQDDFLTDKYFTLAAILDNLIINAIEACQQEGRIIISQVQKDDKILFTVKDNGCGIQKGDLDYIFNAGYSTKYCRKTGKMSTGIGLTHVKNLVETLNGQISVNNLVDGWTQFHVQIDAALLVRDVQ